MADAIALAAKVEEDAHDAAGAKIADAEEQAARILAGASEKANDTIASAERKARSVTETADMVVADAKVKFNDIQKSIAELEAERMSAEVERDKARTEYDGLTRALEKLKSKFKIGE